MPIVERDIFIGEAGDVSIGDLQKNVAESVFWKNHAIVELGAGRVQLEGDWVVVAEGRPGPIGSLGQITRTPPRARRLLIS
jgi:hypothetical protein